MSQRDVWSRHTHYRRRSLQDNEWLDVGGVDTGREGGGEEAFEWGDISLAHDRTRDACGGEYRSM